MNMSKSCFFLLLTLLVSMRTIADRDLPGLDFLSTGFDAVKMINLNEAPSASDKLKFRLFNLDDRSGKAYSFDADGVQQTYKTSRYVQATTINMKTKVSIESLSRSYREFRRSYFQSYSFEIAVPIPIDSGKIDLSFGYHKTLTQVYETITKKEGSVGISSDWWGIYNIHLGPTYLLNFEPLFVDALKKLVSNPKTSRDQAYYNRLIETFGTHYVSAVVVGGMANLYTHVTSSYQKEYSRSTVDEQIKIGFSVAMNNGLTASLNGAFQWGSDVSSLTEEFKKNAELQTKFIPAVVVSPETEKRQWTVWKQRTLSDPAVVNRTLSPLVNLLIDYPDEVQQHLQATINCYLLNGTLPTLAQVLATKTKRTKRALTDERMKPIPGLDVVGCGFDISDIESRQCLFDLSVDKNETSTWIDVYNNDALYMIPSNFFVSSKRDVKANYESRFFKTLDEFFQKSIWSIREDNSGFFGFGATHRQKDITKLYRQFYEYNYQMAWTRRQLSMYTLSVNSFPPPQLNAMTQLAINALPLIFNESSLSNLRKWKAFFNAYGTHFVSSADMGGLMWAEDYFESCLITKTTETWIREQITKRYWFFTENRITEEYKFEIDQMYKKYSMSISKLIGGVDNNSMASSIDPYVVNSWISSVKKYPQPVAYRILPIYTLLPTGERKEALKNATYYFRSQAAKDANLFIQRLQTRPNPPPLPKLDCSPTAGQRRKRATKPVFDLIEARKKLCPVVGFRGTFCPGDPTWNKSNGTIPVSNLSPSDRSINLSPPRDLPKGVGMSVDISNGNILLPALKFTSPLNPKAESLWRDPHSGRVFILPNEITLEPLHDTILKVNVSSYSTPTELIDAWLHLGANGQWSTNFLANLQDISDIDATYFSDDQGTAIAQNYSELYRLQVKNISNPKALPLNSYAQKALDALTSTYNEDLYNAFFNAWGTHIAVATTVGGVTEKQILFQKCLIASIARLGVKEELLSKRPCISYDYHRWRKLFGDQRIGGNADLIQDTDEWFRALAYDPALITIQQYIPWSDIVTNVAIKKNLEGAVTKRVNAAIETRQKQVNQVLRQRAARSISAELILWTVIGTSDIASTTSSATTPIPVSVKNIDSCGTGQTAEKLLASCSFTTNMTACALRSNSYADMNTEVPLSYERNLITGDLRLVALRQNGIAGSVTSFKNYDLIGNWIRRGCSEIINDQCGLLPSKSVHRVQLCTRCRVLCANKNNDNLNGDCSCPTLSENNCPDYSGIGTYLPYCSNEE